MVSLSTQRVNVAISLPRPAGSLRGSYTAVIGSTNIAENTINDAYMQKPGYLTRQDQF